MPWLTTLLVLLASGCGSPEPEASDPELELGRRFVADRAFRRDTLERSLAVRDNDYARLRLEKYAVPMGWDDLPEDNPPVRIAGTPGSAFEPVWAGEIAWTRTALLALGRTAFERWPAQPVDALADFIADEARAEAVGLTRDAHGGIGSVVSARYADGLTHDALSCASCHARVGADGVLAHGAASDLDLQVILNAPASSAAWGPGRVDVTADDRDDPVSIPDLRATRHQRWLHWTGNLDNGLPALAVRIESLLIVASAESVRPPRTVAFALALYVWSLGADDRLSTRTATSPGAELFEQHCVGCHAGSTGEGDVIDASVVGTDPAAASSTERGSSGYRVPSLFRVAERTRLTHEGRFADLDALFDPERADVDPAHPFGLSLNAEQRGELLGFVRGF